MNRRARVAPALAAAVIGLGLSGCGSTEATSAADDVPALTVALGKVDDAMAARRYPAAERLLRQLIADVRGYRDAGELDDDAAGAITAAARRLMAQLPDRDGPPSGAPTTAPESSDEEDQDPEPRPTRTRDDEPTPGPTTEPTEAPSPRSPEPTDPVDPTTGSAADPATETPAAYDPTAPAGTPTS